MPTVGTGKYTYTLIQDWAKLPPGETFAMVSAVATDSQDRVYGFQRKDPPIVIFDRQRQLPQLLGQRRVPLCPRDLYLRRHRVPHGPEQLGVPDVYPGW